MNCFTIVTEEGEEYKFNNFAVYGGDSSISTFVLPCALRQQNKTKAHTHKNSCVQELLLNPGTVFTGQMHPAMFVKKILVKKGSR